MKLPGGREVPGMMGFWNRPTAQPTCGLLALLGYSHGEKQLSGTSLVVQMDQEIFSSDDRPTVCVM